MSHLFPQSGAPVAGGGGGRDGHPAGYPHRLAGESHSREYQLARDARLDARPGAETSDRPAADRLAVEKRIAAAAPTPLVTGPVCGRVHASITEIPRHEWEALFPAAPQSWDYYRAAERMTTKLFRFSAISARSGDRLLATVPMFRVDYRVDAPLGDGFRHIGDWLDRHVPSWITMPVMGMGSPIAEECEIGVAPQLAAAERGAAFQAMVDAMSRHAAENNVRVLAMKDVRARDQAWIDDIVVKSGFSRVPSLPVATLDLPFDSIDAYLASLSPKRRSDLRRKMRQSQNVRCEFRDSLGGLELALEQLYVQTMKQQDGGFDMFDELPGGYFRELMSGLGGRARLLLMWIGDELVGFNLFVMERDRIVGKQLGLRYPQARQHNLYFVNWMRMVQFCVDNGFPAMQVGQTSYAIKAQLGCRVDRSWVYAKHTGTFRGWLFRKLAPLASFDRFDADLAAMSARKVATEAGATEAGDQQH